MSLKPTIFIYNVTNAKRKNKIMSFCVMNGIKGKVIGKDLYQKPLCALLDGEDIVAEESASEDFSEEMLILCNLGGKLDRFLNYLRKEKVIVPLKAVLTPTNQNWNSVQVYKEIKEEHEKMKGPLSHV